MKDLEFEVEVLFAKFGDVLTFSQLLPLVKVLRDYLPGLFPVPPSPAAV
jgi:hypothetical protein